MLFVSFKRKGTKKKQEDFKSIDTRIFYSHPYFCHFCQRKETSFIIFYKFKDKATRLKNTSK